MFAAEDLISDYVDLKVSVRGQVLTADRGDGLLIAGAGAHLPAGG